ncbi:MAG: hypothetical protein KDA89_10475 [Planctomycetaceae bacterium]|nr:hypothetical protein [Planctomycetaceae bacterium]
MSEMEDFDSLPLMDRLKKADYLARELAEHMKQTYLPRLSSLRSAVKVYDPEEVSDQEIMDRSMAVLNAEKFRVELYGKFRRLLEGIREEMRPIVMKNEQAMTEVREKEEIEFNFEDLIE